MQLSGRDRLLLRDLAVGVAGDDAGQSLLEVRDVLRETENRHDLGGDRDVIAVLSRRAVRLSAEAVHDEAELAVVHIDAALPGDLAGIDVQFISLIDVVVEHRGEQVVGSPDRVEIAREVKVDVLHWDDLCVAAAGSTALDAEDRAERRLAERGADVFAELCKAVREADCGRGLALAGRSRRDGGHEDELAIFCLSLFLQFPDVDLGLVIAVKLETVLRDACGLCDLGDLLHFICLSDFNVCHISHYCSPFPAGSAGISSRKGLNIPALPSICDKK